MYIILLLCYKSQSEGLTDIHQFVIFHQAFIGRDMLKNIDSRDLNRLSTRKNTRLHVTLFVNR